MCVASSLIFDVDLPASTLLESMWVLQAFNVKVMKVLRCKYDIQQHFHLIIACCCSDRINAMVLNLTREHGWMF